MNSERDKVIRPQLMTKQVASDEHRLRQLRQDKNDELEKKQQSNRQRGSRVRGKRK